MKIFVVDDDPSGRMIAVDALEQHRLDHCSVHEFESGEALLAAMDDGPDLVLLDIAMPGMDGISACRSMRSSGFDQPQVLFISAKDDLETRLAAYDAGGSDFIVKPYEAEELVQKIRVAEQSLTRRQDLSQQAQFAREAAFTAMSSMGEMGVVMDFLRNSFVCQNPVALAESLLATLSQYGLAGLLEFRLDEGRRCFSSKGECSPLEASVLEHAAGMGRIFQFRDRLVVNYPSVTLLAMALPQDDPDRVGRLRDDLAIITEGADARLNAMETERRQLRQASGIGEAVAELTRTLVEIEKSQAAIRVQSMEIEANFLDELVDTFVRLGLSDSQERILTELAQQTHARINALHDDDYSLASNLETVIGRLRQLTGN